jgi:hypothetical protein
MLKGDYQILLLFIQAAPGIYLTDLLIFQSVQIEIPEALIELLTAFCIQIEIILSILTEEGMIIGEIFLQARLKRSMVDPLRIMHQDIIRVMVIGIGEEITSRTEIESGIEEAIMTMKEKAMGKKITKFYSWKNSVLIPLRRFF